MITKANPKFYAELGALAMLQSMIQNMKCDEDKEYMIRFRDSYLEGLEKEYSIELYYMLEEVVELK